MEPVNCTQYDNCHKLQNKMCVKWGFIYTPQVVLSKVAEIENNKHTCILFVNINAKTLGSTSFL